jgi:RNA-directed DNA polymerase
MAIEPIFEREFAEHSYGFRPGRGCKDALRRVNELLEKGLVHVVDVDIKGYFDNIPHEGLMKLVRERIADGRVLKLIESFLKQGAMEMGEMETEEREQGTPQGGVISPLLANIYLDPLDQKMARDGHELVRYADDMVILCPSAEAAQQVLSELQEWAAQSALTLHPEKTRVDVASLHPCGAACGCLSRCARLWTWGNPKRTSTFWGIGFGEVKRTEKSESSSAPKA